ncbi:hypothetical protein [Burkholderia metallica]|nr:hypothetical protein [Burkholderia metallica]
MRAVTSIDAALFSEQLKARAATHPEGMTGLLSERLVNGLAQRDA